MSELRSNLFLGLFILNVHKTIDRDLGHKEKLGGKRLKKKTNKELYCDIVKFRDNIKAVIKRHKKLSRVQTMEILSKRKNPYNNITIYESTIIYLSPCFPGSCKPQ